MPLTAKITMWGTLTLIAIAIVYDIIIAIEPTPGDTISKISLAHFQNFPFTPWVLGVLIGHLSWTHSYSCEYFMWITIPILLVLGALVFVGCWVGVFPKIMPVAYILLGIPFGHFLWPQQ